MEKIKSAEALQGKIDLCTKAFDEMIKGLGG